MMTDKGVKGKDGERERSVKTDRGREKGEDGN